MDEAKDKEVLNLNDPTEYFNQICRVCLIHTDNLYPIINVVFNQNLNPNVPEEQKHVSLEEIFKKYCDISIKDCDLKPQNICKLCMETAAKAFNLFELFIASNVQLDKILIKANKMKQSELEEPLALKKDRPLNEKDLDLYYAENQDSSFDNQESENDEMEQELIASDEQETDNDEIDSKASYEAQKKRILLKIQRELQIFKCKLCEGRLFKGIDLVIEHLRAVHPLENECILCDKKFTEPSAILSHINKHASKDKKLLICKKCGKSFKEEVAFNEHLESEEHKNFKFTYTCHICKRTFNKKDTLKRHILEVHYNQGNEKGQCSKCGRIFKYRHNLRHHICANLLEKLKEKYLCDICGSDFSTENALKIHTTRIHKIEAKQKNQDIEVIYKCDYCPEAFRASHSFFKHRISHPECTNIQCPLCNIILNTLSDYKTHRSEKHSDYICNECGLGFPNKLMLKSHIQCHKSTQFTCNICEATFKLKRSLEIHVKQHSNNATVYICDYCGKISKQERLHRLHVSVVHNNFKKFKCNMCNRSFTTNWNLKSHLRLHMGYSPFSCPFCKKTFADTTERHRHVKRFHPENMEEFESFKLAYQSEEIRIVDSIPISIMNKQSENNTSSDQEEFEDEEDSQIESDTFEFESLQEDIKLEEESYIIEDTTIDSQEDDLS